MNITEYQKKVHENIVNELRSSNIVILYGAIGSGKTELVNRFFGTDYSSYFAFKEIDKEDESLISMISLSSAFDNRIKNITESTNFIMETDKIKPFSGPLKILFRIFNKSISVSKKLNNFFSDQEINIIISLMKIIEKSDKCNYYLIFDNCEYMNRQVVRFIRQLFINNDINKSFNNRLKIIMVENTLEENSLLANITASNIKVEIDDNTYFSYLKDINHMDKYSAEDMKVLASITSKDLTLTNTLSEYFKKNNIHKDILSQSCTLERLVEIFDKMISKHLDNHATEINCLEVASILGTIINAYDLSKLTDKELDLVINALSFGVKNGLVKEDKPDYSIVSFLHPIIKDLLYKKLENKQKHHLRYNILLKQKYPTRHLIIAENLYRGHIALIKVLDEYYAHLTMLAVRGKLSQFDHQSYEDKYTSNQMYAKYTSDLYKILSAYESRDFGLAYKYINDISPIDIPNKFCGALLNFMEARILVIIGDSNEKFVKVKELLREASNIFLEYNMVDLYFDSLTVLINVLAYKLSDLNSAREIEDEYVIQFQNQVCHAESSELEDNYIEFMRRTASLLDAQGAYERMKNLFAKNSIQDYLPKYKAYNDMIGYSIYEGEFDTAYEYANKMEEYLSTNNFYDFPELYKAQNNILLANLCHETSSDKFSILVNSGITTLIKYEDKPDISNVIKLNTACLYLLAGKYREAENRLLSLFDNLHSYSNALYSTCVPSNLAALYLLEGDFAKAHQYNDFVKQYLYQWDANYRTYYAAQNQYVAKLIENRISITPYALFHPDIDSNISAKTYRFVGRGIMMSELLFYTL